ncbi:MAG: lipopolysaccharide biosynthesis protein [Rhodothermales bacterium]
MQSDYRHNNEPLLQTDEARRARAERTLWATLGTLYRWRRFIARVTGVVAVLAVVLTLLMDNWYQAEARLVLPARTGTGFAAAFLEDLPAAARSFIGSGASGDYYRYLTVLTSRTMYESVVDSFDLVEVYDVADASTPTQAAMDILAANTDFPIDNEYEFLSVRVLDTDRQRAADMANFFVAELNRRSSELASQSARYFRRFVEKRYNETIAELDSLQTTIRVFQETYGVLDLEAQGEQFFAYLAELRLEALKAESQYEVLLSQFGPENTAVHTARQAAQSANNKYQQALAGQERLLPVSKDELPGVAMAYVDMERERFILAKLLEYTRPLLEEARFDEERQIEAVQVVDVAVPPAKKAHPRRSIICILATLSAFMMACLFALVYTWWQRNHAYFAQRLQEATDESEPAAPSVRESADASKPIASS